MPGSSDGHLTPENRQNARKFNDLRQLCDVLHDIKGPEQLIRVLANAGCTAWLNINRQTTQTVLRLAMNTIATGATEKGGVS